MVPSLNEAFDRFRKNLKTKDSTFAENNDWALPRRNSGYRYAREKSVSKSESKGSEIYPAFAKTEKLAEHEKISINTADTAEWKKVPGIGSAYAARIVKYRNLLGGFYEVEQLREVYGISDELFVRISPYLFTDENVRKINVNHETFKVLLNHPYLNYKQVQAIFNLRKKKGRVESLNELSLLDEFTTEDLLRLEPYLEY